MQTPAIQKWLLSHLAVNYAHAAVGKDMVRTGSAVGKETLRKRQQPQNGSPQILLSILLSQQQVRKW